MSSSDFFRECEAKYRVHTSIERRTYEQLVQKFGFVFVGRQMETDFVPDTEDFQCRRHGLLLRFRRILNQNHGDVLLTLKLKGGASAYQENFELECRFSRFEDRIFKHINRILEGATGKVLPRSVQEYDAAQFDQLITKIKSIFPAHRILLEKKRSTYARKDCHVLFDTLPEGMGDYLEIEAPLPHKLAAIIEELGLDADRAEPLDYGDILKRHKNGQPDQEARTGVFSAEERAL